MILRKFKNPTALMRLGLMFLVLANLSNLLLRRSSLAENSRDLIMGIFFGLAFGTLLLWAVTRRNTPPRS